MADRDKKDEPTLLVVGTANIDENSSTVEVPAGDDSPPGAEPTLQFVGTANLDPNSSMVEVDPDAPPQATPMGALPEPEPERAPSAERAPERPAGEGVPKDAGAKR